MNPVGGLPSLRELFDEYARYIWRSLRNLGVAEADVEDLCQDVFITVHRKLPEFEGRSSLKTWLYGICLRTASDYRRRAYIRKERVVADASQAAERAGVDEFKGEAESRQLVLSLLELLDDEKRAVLVLYEIEGFTMKEVAEIVGCPLQTAYSRLYAARALLVSDAREPEAHG
jgi:RNA polymerase sigma-70 factor (ECF subfamily)